MHNLMAKIGTAALTVALLHALQGGINVEGSVPTPAQNTQTILLQPPAISRTLLVGDIRNFPSELALTMISLQGIVNQSEVRLFLISEGNDAMWADWLKTRGDVETTKKLNTTETVDLLQTYRSEVKGQVVVDPAVPATINVATMLSGLDQLIITSPTQANLYTQRYNLPVVEDLRGRFKGSLEAYTWAYNNLWPRMNHHALAMLHSDCRSLRDLLIQQKIWVWWQVGTADGGSMDNRLAEWKITHQVLANSPTNIPVLGYPWHGEGVGPGEHSGVTVFSQYGKYLWPADLASNLSVHRSAQPPKAKLNTPVSTPPIVQPDKTHAAVVFSDGDNLQALLNYFPRYWQDQHKQQRTVPIGWSISPSSWEMIPDVVDWLIANRLPGDYFLASVSGIGYVYLEHYGAFTRNQTQVQQAFFALTDDYMQKLGMTMLWPMSDTGAVTFTMLQKIAAGMESLTAVFPDYGQKINSYNDANLKLRIGDRTVPVFHAVSGNKQTLREDLNRFLAKAPRPAYIHLFLLNWDYSPLELAELGKKLGDSLVLVRPDELVQLYLGSAAK